MEAIRQSNRLADVATKFGVKLTKDGRGWRGCCPLHNDDTPSFTIYTNAAHEEKFKCFGCGAHGDVVDFVMQLKGVDLHEAVKILGGQRDTTSNVVPYPRKEVVITPDDDPYLALQAGSSDIAPQVGVKIELWNPRRHRYGAFTPTHVHHYPGHGYVVRRLTADGKETPQIRISQHGWTRWSFDRPRPLYGRLEGNGYVIVVEGEKCADALMALKPGWRVATWPGGTNGVQYADWRPLAREKVVLWADHDDAGSQCMAKLHGILIKLECSCVLIDTFACTPDLHPKKWDVADLIEEGGDPSAYMKAHFSAKPVDVIAEAERQDEEDIQAGLAPTSLEDIQRAHEAIKETDEKKRQQNEVAMITKVLGMANMEAFVVYNEFAEKIILMKPIPSKSRKPPGSFKPTPITAEHDLQFLLFLQENGFPGATILKAQHVIAAIAYRHRFHPVRDYLEGLTWDGELRLHHWLETALHAERLTIEQDQYVQAVARCVLIGAVARIFRPGCKADSMMILEGVQGAGKSSVVRALCPDPDWFSENLPAITPHTVKEVQEHMLGVWLIEMPELTAMRKSDVEHLKAFLTTTVDRYRIPYGTRTGDHPRQCSFIGTTNSTSYLTRADGNRRFWPVRVIGEIDVGWIEANRDQLWAEAAVAYFSEEIWWLKGDVSAYASEEQDSRRHVEPWLAHVGEALREMHAPVTVEAVLLHIGVMKPDQNQANGMRVAEILKELGWESRRESIAGKRCWRWYPTKEPHLRLVDEDE